MDRIKDFINKGVHIPNPESVEIGETVDLERISGDDVVIHAGCKIFGKSTLILAGSKLGYEAPVTVDNCYIGPNVELKGGFFKKTVFLEKAGAGLGSHVREGTIFEEQANIAHTVALKQTILFPFVTLGSLINFCDCFMAGGTSRKNHSEVGSSYIHFNYTPNQDKATPSLMGDVPKGVMLNQDPIFLGGQGGMVGPCRLNYGTVVAAGTITRKDELRPNRLLFGGSRKEGNIAFKPGQFTNDKRIVENNIVYIANLFALQKWYANVRTMFVSESFPEALLAGLHTNLQAALDERVARLKAYGQKFAESKDHISEFENRWIRFAELCDQQRENDGNPALRDPFLKIIQNGIADSEKNYLRVIQSLSPEDSETGTQWLQGIVDDFTTNGIAILT